MERVRRWEAGVRRTAGHRRGTGSRRRDKRSIALAPREKRRLFQLLICTVLFLAVFLGRGVAPSGMEGLRGELLQVIQTDTDFKAAFSSVGRAIEQGKSGTDVAIRIWEWMLGSGDAWSPYSFARRNNPLYLQQMDRLAEDSGVLLRMEKLQLPADYTELTSNGQQEHSVEKSESEDQTEDVLGIGETAAPVLAPVSSGFGTREHPIEGGEKFHSGLDLAANYGTGIKAFADGVVDYIGESPAYGQYLQLQHANGVTSFYAHCSRLCVQQGQWVKAGEKVAEVGDSGKVTGAHLHFEIKVNGEAVDPSDYIETE